MWIPTVTFVWKRKCTVLVTDVAQQSLVELPFWWLTAVISPISRFCEILWDPVVVSIVCAIMSHFSTMASSQSKHPHYPKWKSILSIQYAPCILTTANGKQTSTHTVFAHYVHMSDFIISVVCMDCLVCSVLTYISTWTIYMDFCTCMACWQILKTRKMSVLGVCYWSVKP